MIIKKDIQTHLSDFITRVFPFSSSNLVVKTIASKYGIISIDHELPKFPFEISWHFEFLMRRSVT